MSNDLAELLRLIDKQDEVIGALLKVAKGIKSTRYGTVEVKVEAGKPIWVDIHKRERVG